MNIYLLLLTKLILWNELVGALCSHMITNDKSSQVLAAFPSAQDIACRYDADALEKLLRSIGLHHDRARRILKLLELAPEYSSAGAPLSFDLLWNYDSGAIREIFKTFDGLGHKSISCLLLYGMRRISLCAICIPTSQPASLACAAECESRFPFLLAVPSTPIVCAC